MTNMNYGKTMEPTTNTNSMKCTVCHGQKFKLRPRKSKLIPNVQMFLCDACFVGKKEPRWAIILVARSSGHVAVSDWVKNNRYVGEPIMLDELID